MDFQTVLYIIAGIIYLIYSAGKAANKNKQAKPQPKSKPSGKSWEEQIRELLEQQQPRKEEPEPRQQPIPQPKPEPQPLTVDYESEEPLDHVPKQTQWQEYLKNKEREMAEHERDEHYSVETDASSLEDHIRDAISDIPTGEEVASEGAEIIHGEEFDARKAFIYSEILNRKY